MKWKRLVPLALAISLLAGCGSIGDSPVSAPPASAPGQITVDPSGAPAQPVSPTAPPPIDLSAFALARAAYPEFPAYPEQPEDGGDWNAFFDAESLRTLMRQVWLMLYTDDGRDALTLANSVWLSDAAQGHYVQDTLDVLADELFSSVYSVPMGTDVADQAITDWVSEQTNGLIGDSGPVLETEAITLAVLASSLYYRAGWTDEFFEANTYADTFTAADGQESRVDFMHKTVDGLFLKRDGYQAAYLPTRLGEMVFVLPDEGVTPESLLENPEVCVMDLDRPFLFVIRSQDLPLLFVGVVNQVG